MILELGNFVANNHNEYQHHIETNEKVRTTDYILLHTSISNIIYEIPFGFCVFQNTCVV